MGKQTWVELTNDTLHETQRFEISHAERILQMPNNGGWHLPENSSYTFSLEDGITFRANKERNNGAETAQGD